MPKETLPGYQPKVIEPKADRIKHPVTCYLGLGSNIEPRKEYIKKAVELLNQEEEISVTKQSKLIETEPEGIKEKTNKFINGVIEITTSLPPITLLQKIKNIEKKAGRKPSKKLWGPREIDIDILLYGDELICEENLTIPHPLMNIRRFVLIPLNEIAPEVIHPILEISIADLYRELPK